MKFSYCVIPAFLGVLLISQTSISEDVEVKNKSDKPVKVKITFEKDPPVSTPLIDLAEGKSNVFKIDPTVPLNIKIFPATAREGSKPLDQVTEFTNTGKSFEYSWTGEELVGGEKAARPRSGGTTTRPATTARPIE